MVGREARPKQGPRRFDRKDLGEFAIILPRQKYAYMLEIGGNYDENTENNQLWLIFSIFY